MLLLYSQLLRHLRGMLKQSSQPSSNSPVNRGLKRAARGGSDCLNRFLAFYEWFSALVTPLPLGALAG